MATNLEDKLNSGLARVKRDALAHMLHLNHVGVVAGAYVEDTRERAGAVGSAPKYGEAAAFVGFIAAHKVGYETDVDVAAGKHDASAACCGWCYLLSE